MKIAEMRSRLGEINDELETLNPEELTDEQSARFDELSEEATGLVDGIEKAEAREAQRAKVAEVAARTGESGGERGFNVPNVNTRTSQDPFDVSDLRMNTPKSEIRARAESAIEQAVGDLDDDMRASAIHVMRTAKHDPTGIVAKRILATGTPAYRTAFQKMAGGQSMLLTSEEREAVQRAQSLTGNAGGFAIPFTLDPTIIYTGDGAANPFRQVCDVVQIATDQWNGVSSAGVSGGYAAEASEVGDDSATLAQPSIDVERWDVFIPFSFEVGQDWVGMENDLRALVDQERDEFDVVAFTSGSGTNEPTGITTALDGTSSEVAPATAETFAVADLYAVENALPPRYRRTAMQAKWQGAKGTANDVRQFDTSGGTDLWVRLAAGTPGELIGYEFYENSALDASSDINTGATADNFVLILGDWTNYKIVDRVGLNWELVPHLFATANNRPNGQRGFLAWGRTGADSVNDNAFRMLSIPTTA